MNITGFKSVKSIVFLFLNQNIFLLVLDETFLYWDAKTNV